MTYEEIIYSIQDLSKNISDDAQINEDHILFIINQIRASLLYQKYKSIKLEVPDSNYQIIDMELIQQVDDCNKSISVCSNKSILTSVSVLPTLMEIGNTSVTPVNYYEGTNISLVSKERMRFVGNNSILRNIIYVSIHPDGKLYFKSSNPQFVYLKKVKVTGVFEDAIAASKLECDINCDLMTKRFPLEEALISILIDTAVKVVTGALYKPADGINDATDNLSDLVTFIRRNVKSALQQQIEG